MRNETNPANRLRQGYAFRGLSEAKAGGPIQWTNPANRLRQGYGGREAGSHRPGRWVMKTGSSCAAVESRGDRNGE